MTLKHFKPIHTGCLALLLCLLAACTIKNDIPYPIVEADITAIEVKGQCDEAGNSSTQANISKSQRTVLLYVDDTADLRRIKLKRLEASNKAQILLNGKTKLEGTEILDLSRSVSLTLRTYQDYLWQITVKQIVQREIKFENQVGAAIIDEFNRNMVVYVNKSQKLNNIKVNRFTLGGKHGTVVPDPSAVPSFDFSQPVSFYVKHGWEDTSKEWKVFVYQKSPEDEEETPAPPSIDEDKEDPSKPRLTDGSFDHWHYTGSGNKLLYNPWQEGGESFWDTGNRGATSIGPSNSLPTEETCNGKGMAAMLESRWIVLKFAAGNIFTGSYLRTTGTNGVLSFGRPFQGKPKSLRINYKYLSKEIDKVGDESLEYLKGRPDSCHIYIALTDWDEPLEIRTRPSERQLFDKNDPKVIAYAELIKGSNVMNYQQVDLPLKYRSNRTPKQILVVASSSKYGDFFTGGVGSKLCIDNFELIY